MEIIITIFKQQLEALPQLRPQLVNLCVEVKEMSTAILYIPREDTLSDFIDLLHKGKISFGVHAAGDELPEVIRWNGCCNKKGTKE